MVFGAAGLAGRSEHVLGTDLLKFHCAESNPCASFSSVDEFVLVIGNTCFTVFLSKVIHVSLIKAKK